MASIEKMMNYALSEWQNIEYRMGAGRGNPNAETRFADCSSFVYRALIRGGFLSDTVYIGSTEDLYRLNGTVLKEIWSYQDVQRGDIFIRGIQGQSLGANGHTGIFLEKDKIIHCNYSNNGVSINGLNNYLTYFLDRKRSRKERYFRPVAVAKTKRNEQEKPLFIKYENHVGVMLYDKVPVYDAPYTKAHITGYLSKGYRVYYVAVYENDNKRWIMYYNYQGQKRYIPYRNLTGNTKSLVRF